MPDATHILISFCNSTTGAPSLALFDVISGEIGVLQIPVLDDYDVSGIAVSEDYVFAVTTNSKSAKRDRRPVEPSVVVILRRHDLSLAATHTCRLVKDAHSVRFVRDSLLVVSTGTNELVRLALRETNVIDEGVIWRPDPDGPREDLHHLNSLCLWHDEMVVSGFGLRSGPTWGSATDGFIQSVSSGSTLVSSVAHPHSVAILGDSLAYCESSRQRVRVLGGQEWHVPGYVRGLCTSGKLVFVATSRGRLISKSSGLLSNRGDPGASAGTCSLFRFSLDSAVVDQLADLSLLSWEIYDLVAVRDVEHWPLADKTEWRDRLIAGIRPDYEGRDATISWLHTEVSQRDANVRLLHNEVAKRDSLVEQLHREVAERDASMEWLHREVATRDETIRQLHNEVALRDRLVEKLRMS